LRAIRGAITVEENTKNNIKKASKELIKKIINENKLNEKDIISITFTATDDLDKLYPAEAIREIGFKYTPLMCCQEMKVKDSISKCIRVMLYTNKEIKLEKVAHIYLKKASKLRKDLTK